VTDERLERMVGMLLRAGVAISAAVVLAGGIWRLVESGSRMPAYGSFRGEPAELRNAGALLRSLSRPQPETLIQFGLLLLIATPVARVILALAAFVLEKDRLYVKITLAVLVVLIYSLVFPQGSG
jgi:uncharacterized membrane protein